MINLFNTNVEIVSIHKLGNKSRNEKLHLSAKPTTITDEVMPLFKEYFFKQFRKKEEEYFQFAHEVDLEYNEIYKIAKSCFDLKKGNEIEFHQVSIDIAKHLFEQSNHPHIKNGELYVAYFRDLEIDNKHVDGIGIFKSEIKSDFFNVKNNGIDTNNFSIEFTQGNSLEKFDKGCIIFNTNSDEGFKILSIDNNKYDARYWLEHFLGVDICEDENFLTKKYLALCNDFSKKVIPMVEDPKSKISFQNATIEYFQKNDEFKEEDFENHVFSAMKNEDSDSLAVMFRDFRINNGEKFGVEDVTEFDISNKAVTVAAKKFKREINLDTNISIKLNFNSPESLERFVEKGWDEERQMYYYLCYFNKEEK